jgi:tRNA pseudouridine55 synthase
MNGIILINKPADVSSFHVVLRVKNLVGIKREKVGHAGTLDPFATGLMIVGIGREATRLLTQLTHSDKVYVATGKLGQATDTLDLTGKVITECPWEYITPDTLAAQCAQLVGPYEQIPPIYSALQYQGQRLYTMARKEYVPTSVLHEIVEQKKRTVRIRDLDLISTALPEFVVKARVSHGTYIRVLVDAIARGLGSCAFTTALDRTAIGPFKSVYALDLEDVTSQEVLQAHLMSVEQVCDLLAD